MGRFDRATNPERSLDDEKGVDTCREIGVIEDFDKGRGRKNQGRGTPKAGAVPSHPRVWTKRGVTGQGRREKKFSDAHP